MTVAGRRRRSFGDGPERMVVGCGEHGERLHAPVRRAGRVVRLAHPAVVVAVADRHHAVAVADRPLAPPAEVTQRHAAHLRPVEGVDVGQRERTPEAALRHAVGEAATERDRATIAREPVRELRREPSGALDVARGCVAVAETRTRRAPGRRCAARTARSSRCSRPRPSVYQPSSTANESMSSIDRACASRSMATPTRSRPICTRRRKNCQLFCAGSSRSTPRSHSTTWSRWRPVSGSQRCSGVKASANPIGGHLHHALVDVVAARPPVLGALRIGAVREAGDPAVPVVERPSAGDQRHDAPQRSRVALQLGDAGCEVRAEGAEPRAGATGRQVLDDRVDEIDDRAPHVVLGGERVAGHGVRPRVERSARHAILPRSSARTW